MIAQMYHIFATRLRSYLSQSFLGVAYRYAGTYDVDRAVDDRASGGGILGEVGRRSLL